MPDLTWSEGPRGYQFVDVEIDVTGGNHYFLFTRDDGYENTTQPSLEAAVGVRRRAYPISSNWFLTNCMEVVNICQAKIY